jgi:hypothetical protein
MWVIEATEKGELDDELATLAERRGRGLGPLPQSLLVRGNAWQHVLPAIAKATVSALDADFAQIPRPC